MAQVCCILGHRNYVERVGDREILREKFLSLISMGVKEFLFGSHSKFNNFCHEVLSEIKEEHSDIKRVYVREYYEELPDAVMNAYLKDFDSCVYITSPNTFGKYKIIARNKEMIKISHYIIFYYDKDYLPEPKPQTKKERRYNWVTKSNSGTKIAYEFALRQNKSIFNLFDFSQKF